MKRTRRLIGLMGVMSLMLFSYAGVVDAASVAITEATVSYGGSNQVIPDDLSNVDNDAVLVSFVADNVTYYSDLVLVDSVTTNAPQSWESHQYGINGTDPGSPTNAITDNRIDSGIANAETNAVFKFASAPTSLSDVFFLFEWKYASSDANDTIQLVDSATNDIGTAVQMANLAQLGSAVVTLTNKPTIIDYVPVLNGVAIPLSDFVAAGQLSSVAGFRIGDPGEPMADIDPLIAGIASPPPPGADQMITPDSIIASSDDYDYREDYTREVENLLDGEEMFNNGDTNNWADWEMNHSGDRFGSGDAWMSDASSAQAQWVIMDLGQAYDIATITIWNMNPDETGSIGRSAKTVDIYYTLDRSGDGNSNDNDALFSNTNWTSYSTGTSVSKNPSNTQVSNPNAVLNNMNITARYLAFNFTDAHQSSNLNKVTVQEIQVFEFVPLGTVVSIN